MQLDRREEKGGNYYNSWKGWYSYQELNRVVKEIVLIATAITLIASTSFKKIVIRKRSKWECDIKQNIKNKER
jgi:hypothetical protein